MRACFFKPVYLLLCVVYAIGTEPYFCRSFSCVSHCGMATPLFRFHTITFSARTSDQYTDSAGVTVTVSMAQIFMTEADKAEWLSNRREVNTWKCS